MACPTVLILGKSLRALGLSPPCKVGIGARQHASPVLLSSSSEGQGSDNTMVGELRLLEGSLHARLHIKCSLHAHKPVRPSTIIIPYAGEETEFSKC